MIAKSSYKEDVHIKGHTSVYGSYCEKPTSEENPTVPTDTKLNWGYSCCKTMEKNKRCPLAEDVESSEPEEVKKPKKKKRKKSSK